MLPVPATTAVWYFPVEDKDIEYQFKFPGAVRALHDTPKSDEVQIFPLDVLSITAL
jgi:hypothetical protein